VKTDFCENWKGSGLSPENKYCRECPSESCTGLWKIVKTFASQNNYEGITTRTKTGKRFRLFTTPEQGGYTCRFQSLEEDRRGTPWNIPKEDFQYVLKTGLNDTPSQTRQKSHVEPVVDLIRQLDEGRHLIRAVRKL